MPQTTIVQEQPLISRQNELNTNQRSNQILFTQKKSAQIVVRLQQNEHLPINSDYMQFQENSNLQTSAHSSISLEKNLRSKSDTIGKQNSDIPDIKCSHTPLKQSDNEQQLPKCMSNLIPLIECLNKIDPVTFTKRFLANFCQPHQSNTPTILISFKQRITDIITQNLHLACQQDPVQQNPFTKEKQNLHRDIAVIIIKIVDSLRLTSIPRLSISDLCFNVLTQSYELDARRVLQKLNCRDYNILVNQLSDEKKYSSFKKQVSGTLCFPVEGHMLNDSVARVKVTYNNQTTKIGTHSPCFSQQQLNSIYPEIQFFHQILISKQKSDESTKDQNQLECCNNKYQPEQKVLKKSYQSKRLLSCNKKVFKTMILNEVQNAQILQSIEDQQNLYKGSKSIETQLVNRQAYKSLISQDNDDDKFIGLDLNEPENKHLQPEDDDNFNDQMDFKKYQGQRLKIQGLQKCVETKSLTDKKLNPSVILSVRQIQNVINQRRSQNTSKKMEPLRQIIESDVFKKYFYENNKQLKQGKDQTGSNKKYPQNIKSNPPTDNIILNSNKTQTQKTKIKTTQNSLQIQSIGQQTKQNLQQKNLYSTQCKQILLLKIKKNLQAIKKLQLENQQLIQLIRKLIQYQLKSNQEYENFDVHLKQKTNLFIQKESNKNSDIYCDKKDKFIESVIMINLIELYRQADSQINEVLDKVKFQKDEQMKMKKEKNEKQIKVLQTIYIQNQKVLDKQTEQNLPILSLQPTKQPTQTPHNNFNHQQQSQQQSQNSFTHLNEFSSQQQQKPQQKSEQKLSQTNQSKSQLPDQTQRQQQENNLEEDKEQLTNLNESIHSVYSCRQQGKQGKDNIKDSVTDRNKLERKNQKNCEESFFSQFDQKQSVSQSNDSFANLNHQTEKNGQKSDQKQIAIITSEEVSNNITNFEQNAAQNKQFKQKKNNFLKKDQISVENSVMNKGFVKNESFFVVDEASLELAKCLSEQQKSYYLRVQQQKLPSKSQHSQNFLNIPVNQLQLTQPLTTQKLINLQKAINLSTTPALLKHQYLSTLSPTSTPYQHFSNIPSEQFNLKDLHQFYHPYPKQNIINLVKYQTHYSQFVQEGVYQLSESKNKSLDLCFNVVRFCLINLVTHYRNLSLLKIEQEVKQTLYPSQYQWTYLDQKKTNAKWLNCEDKLNKAMALSYQKIQQYKNRIQRQPDSLNVKKTIQLQRQKPQLINLINQLNSKNNQNQHNESQDSKDKIQNNIQLMTKVYDWIIILLSEEYLNKAHLEKCLKKICKKYKVTGFKYQEVFGNSNFKHNIQRNQTYRRIVEEFLIYVIQMIKIWHIISNLPHYSYFTEKQNIRRKSMTEKKLPAPKKVEEILKTLDIFYIYKGQRLNTEYMDKKMNEQPDRLLKTMRFYLNLAEIMNPFYEDNQLRMKQLFFVNNQNQKNFMKKQQKSENKFIEQQIREIHKQKISIFQKDEYKSTFNKIFQKLYQPKPDKNKTFSLDKAFLSQAKQVACYLKQTLNKI